MQTTTTTIKHTNKGTSYRPKEKVYPKTLKGCFSFEEFQDLLNEKIRKHYEEKWLDDILADSCKLRYICYHHAGYHQLHRSVKRIQNDR